MAKFTAFEVPPPGAGLVTVTDAVPAFAILAAGTVTVSCVLLTKRVLFRAVPFQLTAEPLTKFVPLTVKLNCDPPAVALLGERLLMFGSGLLTVKCIPFEV